MKVVYFGTPEYAVAPLKALLSSHHKVVGVVTQPDRPKGRSGRPIPSPVKAVALENGIPVFQYEKIKKEDISDLLSIDADIYVTCAYGQILGENILNATKFGVVNLHGSVLPKYRGASPIQWALINGETTTGVTALKSGIGMDDGDIIKIETIDVSPNDNALTLFEKLSLLSADMVVGVLDSIENGSATFTPQDHSLATFCSMLKPEMCSVDFSLPATTVLGLIKGLAMWPNVKITANDKTLKLYNAVLSFAECDPNTPAGSVIVADSKRGLHIKCGKGAIEITELLPENGKKMTAKSYLNGKIIPIGSIVK